MSYDLQRRHRESWSGQQLYAVTVLGGFYAVHEHTPDGGVCPVIEYATPQEVIARLMQLLKSGPVDPQTWPERVEITDGM